MEVSYIDEIGTIVLTINEFQKSIDDNTENIKKIYQNELLHKEKLNEIIDQVNMHKDNITLIDDILKENDSAAKLYIKIFSILIFLSLGLNIINLILILLFIK